MRSTSVAYSVYGLGLCADRPIPGLIPPAAPPRVDVRLYLGSAPALGGPAVPWYVSPHRDERGRPISTFWKLAGDEYLRVRFRDGTEFVVDRRGARIWATWPESSSLEGTASYLLGPVLGAVLLLRGVTCLHASAVAVEGRAVAFVGPSGAGKSTTAAALAGRGCAVLADDIVALTDDGGTYLAQPGYPRLRLWPRSVDALSADGTCPPLPPEWGERRYYLDVTGDGYRFEQQALPLAAVYLLDERPAGAAAPAVETVSMADGLVALVANTFANYLQDGSMRAREFGFLGRMMGRVPVRRILSHGDLADMPRLCDLICRDVSGAAEPRGATQEQDLPG